MTHDHASDVAILGSAFVGLVVDRVAGSAISVATTIPHDAIAPLTTAVVALTLKLVDHVIKTREARDAADHAERVARASVPSGPPRVLVVEDDEVQHISAAQAAEAVGCAIERASTARETFRALARDRGIRLVLLDLYLPDGGPVSAFAADVRAASPQGCVIVVVSGHESGADIAAKIGARFLLKPAGADVLTDVMREALT